MPQNYPVMGKDAFRTATGVHAAAVIKAYKKMMNGWQIMFIQAYLHIILGCAKKLK